MPGEVVSSPAPLVGYNPPWIEPGQVKLQDVGAGLISAFALGVEQNRKRQQLENALAKISLENQRLEMQNEWKDKEYQYKYDALQVRDMYNQAALGLKEQNLGVMRDRLSQAQELGSEALILKSLHEENAVQKASESLDGGASYFQAVNEIPRDKVGTNEGQQMLDQINHDYAQIINSSKFAQRYQKQRQDEQTDAMNAQIKADNAVMSGFNKSMEELNKSRSGFNRFSPSDWLATQDSDWGEDKKNQRRWRAYQINPDDPTQVTFLSPEQEAEKVKSRETEGLNYRSLPTSEYNHMRRWQQTASDIQSRRLGERPGSSQPSGFRPGVIYKDPVTQKRALYNADGTWTEL